MLISELYFNNLLAVAFIMLLGWLVSLYKKNVTIVDSLWGLGFIFIAWLTWFQTDGYWGRKLLLAGLTTIWGLRLAVYLTWRNHGKGEDPRYAKWRQSSGRRFWWISLFKVFLLQALFLWAIALSVQAGQTSRHPAHLGVLDLVGTGLWLIGFAFEALGDWQLARFKSIPANRGKVMNLGLWRYTRHPNYFGECLIWWGLFIIALSDPRFWWTALSPVIITTVLLKMTGIALTEKVIVEKRPEYREYQDSTPAFFPWVPKNSKK
jgi:steroid 5-alpha reductase family enzyme